MSRGKVLQELRRLGAAPNAAGVPDAAGEAKTNADKEAQAKKVEEDKTGPAYQISDMVRGALTFTSYDLDVHLSAPQSGAAVHARFTVRNNGAEPLTRVALQISSALQWERFVLEGTSSEVPFVQHAVNTDADHTGGAQEAILTLAEPLPVGGVLRLSAFYSGLLAGSAGRLERIGAPVNEAERADWDKVSSEGTWLRGFGNVLWYPTAAAPVFLGDGAKLFQAVGQAKQRQAGATIRLRLTIEYAGDAPKWVYFCGRREPLVGTAEDMDAPAASAPGVATAEFAEQVLGFRVPSLFVPEGSLKLDEGPVLAVLTSSDDAVARYTKGVEQVQPLVREWLGDSPLRTMNIVDHAGQPFEDRALLVASMAGVDADGIAAVLAHSLSHAWFGSSQVWLDEGVAQWMGWLWLERTHGREFAVEQIRQQATALAFAEPGNRDTAGQSLLEARDEVYYRTKAASVLWMLRSVAGDAALKEALQLYRKSTKRAGSTEDAKEFQRLLEAASHKSLGWFFDDWVYRDRGLPDLSVVSVTPRELQAKDGRGGFLVAVEVRNSGDAVAEVPVTVRSGTLTATERLRIPARSSASTRILFESNPVEVVVNDGSVPEVGNSVHVREIRR